MEIFMSDKVVGDEAPELVLARWAPQTRYDDLPSDVVAGMKLLVRTILGTAVAGSSADGCGAVLEQVRQWCGRLAERRVGTEWVSPCRSSGSPSHSTNILCN